MSTAHPAGTVPPMTPFDKALWPAAHGQSVDQYVAEGHHRADGSMSWPVMVLREEALAHNIATMARFCADNGFEFAPHGKTSMAPTLFRRQLAAGARGITLATAAQLRVARAHGIGPLLLAHELLDASALNWIARELAADPTWFFGLFVDSAEGVAAAAHAGRAHGLTDGISLILDIGYPGGRTGVRTRDEALRLAALIAKTDGVRLVGINGYEGGLATVEAVREFFSSVRDIAARLVGAELLGPKPIITAGGSAYFDVVASDLGSDWAATLGGTILLRSGAYLTHDHGTYARKTPFNRIAGELRPALEIWAQVVSVPEPGLALIGMGKRDAPYDSGLPVPLGLMRAGREPGVWGADEPIAADQASVPAMDDQHCYLKPAGGLLLRPGDLVRFGISHPCTAFDKWRAIPTIDAADRVIDVVHTYF